MKKVKTSFFLLIFLFCATVTFAQIDVTSSGGTSPASYTTLGAAFTAINTGVHTGTISISVVGNTTEAGASQLDSSGNGSGSNYTSISITASGGNRTITGTVAGPMITFMGADNVLINGVNSGGVSLTFTNTGSGTTVAVLKLINDAINNRFLNTTFKGGSNTSTTTGAVIFMSTASFTGNDNNAFVSCNFDGSGTMASCFLSTGTTTSSFNQNSADTLLNCNFFDYFNSATASPIGTFINSGNTDWLIQGNSWYQTTNRSTASQGVHTGLQIFPAWTTDQHQVINNFVGGTGPGATGNLTYSASSTNVVGAIGMSLQTGGPGGLIQGNTVKNINVSYAGSAGSFGNAGYFLFIGGYDGTVNFNSNTVDNFNVTNTLGAALGSGINPNGRITTAGVTVKPTFNITNNTVTNMTFNPGGAGSAQFYGIRLEASSGTSITTGTSNPNYIVTGNYISGLNITTAAVSNWVRGIGTLATNGTSATAPLWPKATIQNNTISSLNSNSTLASYSTLAAVGIQIAGSLNANNTVDTFKVIGNNISNLNQTNSTEIANSVGGIQGTNATGFISGNKIYNLTSASPGSTAAPMIAGINWRATFNTTYINNNYIALGGGITTNTHIFGIISNFAASRPFSVNYNSIYITGTPSSGTRNCAAFHRGTETFTGAIADSIYLYNNLLLMERSGGSASYYGVSSYGTGTWFSNYNAIVSPSASTAAFWNAASNDFSTYKANTLGDGSSVNAVTGGTTDFTVTPAVLNPADLFNDALPAFTGVLNIRNINQACWFLNGKGTAISNIATDYNGNARSTTLGLATDIGGHEFTPSGVNPPALVESGSFTDGGTTSYSSFGRNVMNLHWNTVGTITTRNIQFYSGTTPPGTLDPAGRYSNGYWEVGVNGGASGYNYDITLLFDAAILGTVVNDANMKIGKRETPFGDWNIVTSTNNLDNTITASGLSSFSQFALTDQNFPMPVELSSFTANVDRNKVTLNWSTISEQNNAGFDVERKAAGSELWVRAGNVAGYGNSNTVRNYSYSENNVATGKYNYRLKQTDINGNFKYYNLSNEVNVGVPVKFSISQNYPNPFNPTTNINYDIPFDSKVMIRIFDITGREVASLVNQVQVAGYYSVNFNASALSSGVYFYTITADGGNQSFAKTLKMMLVK